MNILHITISALVFGSTLMLGTTAVIASSFVITTVAGLTKLSTAPVSVVIPAAEQERVVDLPDLRNEPPPTPEDFDPSGPYSLDIEKIPAAFADIEFIEIATREYDEEDGAYVSRPIIPTGSLHTKKVYAFSKIAVGDRAISFETTTVDGISYQFVGTFPVSSESITCEGCEYPADLNGRLKKLKNGRVIAELGAKFYVTGC